eukprot:Rmarinus@m.2021
MLGDMYCVCIDEKTYKVAKQRILQFPNSKLSQILRGSDGQTIDLCRDPEGFEVLLRFLRTDKLILHNCSLPLEALLQEAEWYGIETFTQALQLETQRRLLGDPELTRKEVIMVLARSDRRSFRGLRLPRLALMHLDLLGTNFGRANIRGCRMDLVDAGHSVFTNADCSEVSFAGAALQFCKFQNAVLKNANFSQANLFGSWLDGADLDGARFEGANLERVSFEGCVNVELADFSGALNILKAKHLVGASIPEHVLEDMARAIACADDDEGRITNDLKVPTLEIDGYLSDGGAAALSNPSAVMSMPED